MRSSLHQLPNAGALMAPEPTAATRMPFTCCNKALAQCGTGGHLHQAAPVPVRSLLCRCCTAFANLDRGTSRQLTPGRQPPLDVLAPAACQGHNCRMIGDALGISCQLLAQSWLLQPNARARPCRRAYSNRAHYTFAAPAATNEHWLTAPMPTMIRRASEANSPFSATCHPGARGTSCH